MTWISLLVGVAAAAPPPAPDCDVDRPVPAGAVEVYVLTAAPGPRPYSFFGHSALWLRMPDQNIDHIWEYGVIDARSGEPLTDVLMGTLRTGWGVDPRDKELRRYQTEGRRLLAQRIDLPGLTEHSLRRDLLAIARRGAKAEFTERFHWAERNCTTHLRDLLDRYTSGALAEALDGPAPLTHRHEVQRHLAPVPWAWFGLHALGGAVMDAPRTRWESAFLPVRLYEALDRTRVEDDGVERPLVLEVCTLHPGPHDFPAPEPPSRLAACWALGGALGGLFFGLSVLSPRSRAARVTGGALLSIWGLLLGIFGAVLSVLWAASAWWGWSPNHNLLLAHPLSLALVPVGVLWARGRVGSKTAASAVALAVVGATAAAFLAVPAWPQEGLDLFGLLWLPTAGAAVGLALQARRLR